MTPIRLLLAYPGAREGALAATPIAELLPGLDESLSYRCIELAPDLEDEVLVMKLSQALDEEEEPHARVILGGFSLGARIAVMVSARRPVAGVLGLSYPFHRHGQPQEQHGLEVLQTLTCPCLLLQGTRDSHGNRQQVRGMPSLPEPVKVQWLEDGNHHWRGRRGGGREHHVKDAAAAIRVFAEGLVRTPHV